MESLVVEGVMGRACARTHTSLVVERVGLVFSSTSMKLIIEPKQEGRTRMNMHVCPRTRCTNHVRPKMRCTNHKDEYARVIREIKEELKTIAREQEIWFILRLIVLLISLFSIGKDSFVVNFILNFFRK